MLIPEKRFRGEREQGLKSNKSKHISWKLPTSPDDWHYPHADPAKRQISNDLLGNDVFRRLIKNHKKRSLFWATSGGADIRTTSAVSSARRE